MGKTRAIDPVCVVLLSFVQKRYSLRRSWRDDYSSTLDTW